MSQYIVSITDASFENTVLQKSGLVFVDFWAPWCGPCKSLAPILDELSSDYEGEITIVKINADENPESSKRFNVRSLPNMILFKDGIEIERVLGISSKSRLAAFFDIHLEA